MRIGLVCRHYTASRGGLEKYTLNLSEELLHRGHQVHIFCNTGDIRPGIFLHRIPIFPVSSPGKNLSFALKTPVIISKLGLDLVQSMERIWSQDIFRASDGINPIQIQEKYPNLLWRTFKTLGPRRQVLSLLERRIFQKGGAKWFITNSNLVKNQIIQYYKVPLERISVIYNSVDTNRFNMSAKSAYRSMVRRELGIGPDDRLILFAGNDFQRKGLALLIEAMARTKDRSIKLLVAGSDPPGHYQRLASKCGMGDNILFVGHHKCPEKLYGTADIFALPTRYDAFANVCLEAMACGTPVITTKTNGAAEIIENGKEGYILETWEPEEIVKRLKDAFELESNTWMGSNAARKAGTFTMEMHMKSILSLYDKVCGKKTS